MFSRFDASSRYLMYFIRIIAGIFCLLIGIAGIILPVIPGVIFLLFAVLIFTNKQVQFMVQLHQNETTGPILRYYYRKIIRKYVLKRLHQYA